MAYAKQTWVDGVTPLDAEHLNHMEQGISQLSDEIVTTAESKVAAHNSGTDTHSDIRVLIQGLTNRLNALADSDDTTLDQLSEVVSYIKSNRTLIEAITTSKVSVADIVDNLTTNVANKPLSAAQGVALKALIDAITIPHTLPNPNALTFTGAVTGSYDGSVPVSVKIPSGGGGDNPLRLIKTVTLAETVKSITVDTDNDGNAFSLSEIYIITNVTNSEGQTEATSVGLDINGKALSLVGTTAQMNFVCGKTGESGRNWIWLMSLNPLRVLHGTWVASNISSGKTVQCWQTNEFNATNPNPYSVGEKITSIKIYGVTSKHYLAAGSQFRIYGR